MFVENRRGGFHPAPTFIYTQTLLQSLLGGFIRHYLFSCKTNNFFSYLYILFYKIGFCNEKDSIGIWRNRWNWKGNC